MISHGESLSEKLVDEARCNFKTKLIAAQKLRGPVQIIIMGSLHALYMRTLHTKSTADCVPFRLGPYTAVPLPLSLCESLVTVKI